MNSLLRFLRNKPNSSHKHCNHYREKEKEWVRKHGPYLEIPNEEMIDRARLQICCSCGLTKVVAQGTTYRTISSGLVLQAIQHTQEYLDWILSDEEK